MTRKKGIIGKTFTLIDEMSTSEGREKRELRKLQAKKGKLLERKQRQKAIDTLEGEVEKIEGELE